MSAGSPVIVFDVSGVIVHWQPLDLMRRHFPEHAYDDTSAAEVLAQVSQGFAPEGDWGAFDRGEVEPDALAQRIAQRTGYARANVKALVDAIPEHTQPMPDSVALIERLRDAGHRLALLSNMPVSYAAHLEREHACFNAFEHRTWSGRVGVMKPQPQIFDRVREALAVADASQLIFIDDVRGNVDAARALGWQAVHFTTATDCARQLQRLGCSF